ncbi:MAG: helix-turn-helix transcriptional regulator [Ruminococcaceae bacterium]|nr:helix-turn-helix transcriptional regulator [Oscillospiraceae bacterium]
MSIASDLIRGHTETIILALLQQGESYGYRINKAIRTATDGEYELKEATLYTAFRRLEDAGYIRSYWGNEESGARRRYYAITDAGHDAYRQSLAEWRRANTLINRLVTGEYGQEAATEGGTLS